jgi:hypothetical protein
VGQPSQEWFINTPVLWFAGLVLLWFLRRSFWGKRTFFKRILEFVPVSCFALGTIVPLMWRPVVQTAKENKPLGPLWILLLGTVSIAWIVSFFRIFLFRKNVKLSRAAVAVDHKSSQAIPQRMTANVPNERFADLGGMDDAKEQIRQMVEAHLRPREEQALWPVAKWNSALWPARHGQNIAGKSCGGGIWSESPICFCAEATESLDRCDR